MWSTLQVAKIVIELSVSDYPRRKAFKFLLEQQGTLALVPGIISDSPPSYKIKHLPMSFA